MLKNKLIQKFLNQRDFYKNFKKSVQTITIYGDVSTKGELNV